MHKRKDTQKQTKQFVVFRTGTTINYQSHSMRVHKAKGARTATRAGAFSESNIGIARRHTSRVGTHTHNSWYRRETLTLHSYIDCALNFVERFHLVAQFLQFSLHKSIMWHMSVWLQRCPDLVIFRHVFVHIECQVLHVLCPNHMALSLLEIFEALLFSHPGYRSKWLSKKSKAAHHQVGFQKARYICGCLLVLNWASWKTTHRALQAHQILRGQQLLNTAGCVAHIHQCPWAPPPWPWGVSFWVCQWHKGQECRWRRNCPRTTSKSNPCRIYLSPPETMPMHHIDWWLVHTSHTFDYKNWSCKRHSGSDWKPKLDSRLNTPHFQAGSTDASPSMPKTLNPTEEAITLPCMCQTFLNFFCTQQVSKTLQHMEGPSPQAHCPMESKGLHHQVLKFKLIYLHMMPKSHQARNVGWHRPWRQPEIRSQKPQGCTWVTFWFNLASKNMLVARLNTRNADRTLRSSFLHLFFSWLGLGLCHALWLSSSRLFGRKLRTRLFAIWLIIMNSKIQTASQKLCQRLPGHGYKSGFAGAKGHICAACTKNVIEFECDCDMIWIWSWTTSMWLWI